MRLACTLQCAAGLFCEARLQAAAEPGVSCCREPLHPSLTYAVEQIMVLGDLEPINSDADQQEEPIPHILHHINVGSPEDTSHDSEAEAKEDGQEKVHSCRHHHR